MERQLSELLKNLSPELTTKEVLEHYKHIHLSEGEMDEAILWGKKRKEALLKQSEENKRLVERRALLTAKTNYDLTVGLTKIRMINAFPEHKPFVIDSDNEFLYKLLCYYFGEDQNFVSLALEYGVVNPSLSKGIFLAGNFGTGKTYLMKLFAKNHRQCYEIANSKDISIQYKEQGESFIEQSYVNVKQSAFEDPSVLYQKRIGLCIDDLGTEDEKRNYGDKKNVVGDIIEQRYFHGNCGPLLHMNSNLTSQQLTDYYGGRVVSRLREVMNFIVVKGSDRRK